MPDILVRGHRAVRRGDDENSESTAMPIVTIEITREGTEPGQHSITREQKAKLIEGASKLMLDVLNKPLESTFVVVEEVDLDNWGWGGLPVEEYRKRLKSG